MMLGLFTLVKFPQLTCDEVHRVVDDHLVLHVPAPHAQPVGGVLLQVVDRDTAVGREEVGDMFGLLLAGSLVPWAVG